MIMMPWWPRPHLVISLTEELEFLRLLVHEHSVKVARLHAPGVEVVEEVVEVVKVKVEVDMVVVDVELVEEVEVLLPDLDGLVAPAHDLADADVGHAGRQLAPLENYVLAHLHTRVTTT